MTVNEGTLDRAIRVIIGLALIGLALVDTTKLWGWSIGMWGWIGIVPLATGLLGWCPLYTMLGINSCPTKKGAY
jgi:Protein of unknown function (DUF2892)